MKYVTNLTIAAGVAGTLLLGACGGEEQSELRQELAAMTKDLRGRVDPLPQVKSFEPVPYKGESMVDPYQVTSTTPGLPATIHGITVLLLPAPLSICKGALHVVPASDELMRKT